MDERWGLEDLHLFPHAFAQAYEFAYCLDSDHKVRNPGRIDDALQEYPWGGGYSYLNIYTVLRYQIPKESRPLVQSIQYASPGWIELVLNADVAVQVAKSVAALSGAGAAAAYAYQRIDKARLAVATQRRKARIEDIKLTRDEIIAYKELSDEAAKAIDFNKIKELHERTQDPSVSLNLLMAHWRRLNKINDYVKRGKVRLPKIKNSKK